MIEIKSCPNCGKTYESGLYREKLGTPIVFCIFCMTSFIDKSVNEWELRGINSKIWYLLFIVFDIFITGMTSAFAINFLVLLPDLIFKTSFSHFMLNGADYFIGLIIICLIFNFIRVIHRELKDFSASKTRMLDRQYREKLKAAGLLK